VIEGFQAFGSACLTGAPTVLTAPVELHPVLGCPAPSAAAPPNGAAPDGFLRLTDRLNDQAGAVLCDVPISATQGVEITFEQWQYGSDSIVPADGIAFFLVDGATSLDAPGAFGGSLGHAQKEPGFETNPPFLPGVEGGYLGIGLIRPAKVVRLISPRQRDELAIGVRGHDLLRERHSIAAEKARSGATTERRH
jgi:hypothetical protein